MRRKKHRKRKISDEEKKMWLHETEPQCEETKIPEANECRHQINTRKKKPQLRAKRERSSKFGEKERGDLRRMREMKDYEYYNL